MHAMNRHTHALLAQRHALSLVAAQQMVQMAGVHAHADPGELAQRTSR